MAFPAASGSDEKELEKKLRKGTMDLLRNTVDTTVLGTTNPVTGMGGAKVNMNLSAILNRTKTLQNKLERWEVDPQRKKQERSNRDDDARLFHASMTDFDDFIAPVTNLGRTNLGRAPARRKGPSNVEAFLKEKRHNALEDAFRQTLTDTKVEFQQRHFSQLRSDWEREKDLLRQILSVESTTHSQQVFTPMDDTFTDPAAAGGTALHAQNLPLDVSSYAQVVRSHVSMLRNNCTSDFNLQKRIKTSCNMVDEFLRATEIHAPRSEESGAQIAAIWKVIRDMCASGADTRDGGHPYETRIKHYIKAAKQSIESSYEARVAEAYDLQPGAQLPNGWWDNELANTAVASRDEQKWAPIYFCLRAGAKYQQMAIAQCQQLDNFEHQKDVERAIKDLHSGSEATQKRTTIDERGPDRFGPFKLRVLYFLQMIKTPGSKVAERAPFTDDTDEWLWFQLRVVEITSENASGKGRDHNPITEYTNLQINIRDPQRTVTVIATADDVAKQLQAGKDYWCDMPEHDLPFCRLLLLTGQFEHACELLRQSRTVLAVHFAVLLEHRRLLNTADNWGEEMCTPAEKDSASFKQNFGQLIQNYAARLHQAQPEIALDYYYLLRKYAAPSWGRTAQHPVEPRNPLEHESLFMFAVADMLLETRQWTHILGRYEHGNDTKTPGIIDKYEKAWRSERNEDGEESSCPVITYVAHRVQSKGQIWDAVHLYDLADKKTQVMTLLNQALSQDPTLSRTDARVRQIKDFANRIIRDRRYNDDPLGEHDMLRFKQMRKILRVVLMLHEFFSLCADENFLQALTLVKEKSEISTKYFPTKLDEVEDCVQNFNVSMPPEINRQIPQFLLSAMNALRRRYAELRSTARANTFDGGRAQTMDGLREWARSLVLYSGQIPYRMPGDINAQLLRMEVEMM